MQFKHVKLGPKITLAISSMVTIFLTLFIVLVTYTTNEMIKTNMVDELNQMSGSTEKTIDLWVDNQIKVLEMIGSESAIQAGFLNSFSEKGNQLLASRCKMYPEFENIFVTNLSGKIIMDGAGGVGTDISSFACVIGILKENKDIWVDKMPYPSPISGKNVFVVAKPLKDQNGKRLGIIGAAFYFNQFVDQFITQIHVPGNGYACLINSEYRFLYHPDSSLYNQDMSNNQIVKKAVDEKNGLHYYLWIDGNYQYGAYHTNSISNWTLLFSVYESDLLAGSIRQRNKLIVAGAVFMILFITSIMFLMKKILVQSLNEFVNNFSTGASGDLTVQATVRSQDEIGLLSQQFNHFVSRIAEGMRQIRTIAGNISSSVTQVSATSEELSANSQSTTQEINSIAGAISEITSNTEEISQNANRMKEGAEANAHFTNEANQKNDHLSLKMKELSQREQEFVVDLEKLKQNSDEISTIVGVIEDIADQTNLLALNAAIEAARAGEHGRGFAVVADEVRKLAEKTQNSTKEISGMVGDIQTNVNKIVSEISSNVKEIQSINQDVLESTTMIKTVNQSTLNTLDLIKEITQALHEQKKAMELILQNSESINSGSLENNSGLDQIVQAISDLNLQVEDLIKITQNYKLDENGKKRNQPTGLALK